MPRARSRRSLRDPQRLLGRDDRVVGIDPRRQVPQPLPSLPAGDRDLAPLHHEVEQLLDVAVVGPPGRPPGHRAGVRQLAHRQRPRGLQPREDVPPAGVVGLHPVAPILPASRATRRARASPPCRRGRARGPRRSNHRLQLDQRPVLEGVRAAPPGSTTTRGGSTRPGRRSGRPRRSGRAGARSGGAPSRAARPVARRRAAGPARRSAARRPGRAAWTVVTRRDLCVRPRLRIGRHATGSVVSSRPGVRRCHDLGRSDEPGPPDPRRGVT